MGLMRLAEEDIHQIIAAAIEAGRPDSQHQPELSTGLRDVEADSLDAPVWASDPRFGEFVVDRVDSNEGGQQGAAESLPDLLNKCQSLGDLERTIKGENHPSMLS